MLDIDALGGPIPLDRHIVYKYRGGELKPRMLRALKTAAAELNFTLKEVSSECLGFTGLLPTVRFCDFRSVTDCNAALLALIGVLGRAEPEFPVAVFVPCGAELFSSRNWDSVSRFCRLLEEYAINQQTIATLVESLIKTSDLLRTSPLREGYKLVDYFKQEVSQRSLSLEKLQEDFDRIVLLHADARSGVLTKFGSNSEFKARAAIHRSLEALLVDPGESTASVLVSELCRSYRGGTSASDIISGLMRTSGKLLASASTAPAQQARVIWSVLLTVTLGRLLLADERANTRAFDFDTLPVQLDRLAHDFAVRAANGQSADPFHGLWARVSHMAEAEPKPEAIAELFEKLTLAFANRGNQPMWAHRLVGILTKPSGKVTPVAPRRPTAPGFSSFADIVGNDKLISSLKRRLKDGAFGTATVLHGPDGIGKETIARTYAKIFLCPGRSAEGAACNAPTCSSCSHFNLGGDFGLIEFDCATSEPLRRARELSDRLRYRTFSDRRCVLIRNLDSAPFVLEPLLKTLEEHSEYSSYVFSVDDINALSGASRSRCFVHRVDALNEHEARVFVHKLNSKQKQQPLCAKLVELILYHGRGRPGRLAAAVEAATQSRDSPVLEIEHWSGLGRLCWAIAYWRRLCDPRTPYRTAIELPSEIAAHEAVKLVQQTLTLLSDAMHGRSLPPNPQLLTDLHELRKSLTACAHSIGGSFEQLWSSLAKIWAGAEVGEQAEFESRTRMARSILIRKPV